MSLKLEWGPDEGKMTWEEAVKLAASKGGGWRLPTVAELVSQYDYDTNRPKDAGWSGWYWSSSPLGDIYAWFVDFVNGYVNYYHRNSEYGVRCVHEVDGISTDRSDESRERYALHKERNEAQTRAQAWEETAQKVVALFDPLNPRVSPGVLSAVARGVKTANLSLRTDREALRGEVERLKAELGRVKQDVTVWGARCAQAINERDAARAEVERLKANNQPKQVTE